MRERAAWILALVATMTVLSSALLAERRVAAAEHTAYEATTWRQSQAIGALRTALQSVREGIIASERRRQSCEEGLGLARLRQHWIDEKLGISERLEESHND